MMDHDGYPTKETLAKIAGWDFRDFDGLAKLLVDCWIYPGYIEVADGELRLSTGGWSGHEDLVGAIPAAWNSLHKMSWTRGGHYLFRRRPFNEDDERERQQRLVSACVHYFAGLAEEAMATLDGVSLPDLVEAHRRARNTPNEQLENGGERLRAVCDDRAVAALYVAANYEGSHPSAAVPLAVYDGKAVLVINVADAVRHDDGGEDGMH